jgi:hypothetical protein
MIRNSLVLLRLILLTTIALFAAPLPSHAGLMFDLRAVSATGGVFINSRKDISIYPATGGEFVAGLWAVVTGANAELDDNRIISFAVTFLSFGTTRMNLVNQRLS